MTDDFWAQALARRTRMDERLRAAPVQRIEGVVGPNGATAGKSGGESRWTTTLTLQPWRVAGEPLRATSLTLRRQVDDAELRAHREAAPPYASIDLQARLLEDADLAGPEGWIESMPRAIDDAELAEHARRLRLPVTYQDDQFGTCTLDRQVDWFDAKAQWHGASVQVHLQTGTLDALPAVLAQAHRLWREEDVWHARLIERALTDLLTLKNESWREEDEPAVTADEFVARLAPQSVCIDAQGAFEFCFFDGDLFWGHAVMIDGSLESGPTRANIAG